MPPIVPSSAKALSRLLSAHGRSFSHRNGFGSIRRSSSKYLSHFPLPSPPCRDGKSSNIGNYLIDREVGPPSIADSNCGLQRRHFIGVGDGAEGDVLSKVYEEKRIMGYSPEQLFAVVEAVDLYEDFVPWCQRSKIIRRNNDGSFDAELEIGFKFLVESYVSHVEMKKPKHIKTTASESGLFDHLINVWEFNPGPVPGTCDLHFFVDFKFQSPLYRQVASMFFKEVVSRLVGSFSDRCRRIYGPGVQVLENAYGQGR